MGPVCVNWNTTFELTGPKKLYTEHDPGDDGTAVIFELSAATNHVEATSILQFPELIKKGESQSVHSVLAVPVHMFALQ